MCLFLVLRYAHCAFHDISLPQSPSLYLFQSPSQCVFVSYWHSPSHISLSLLISHSRYICFHQSLYRSLSLSFSIAIHPSIHLSLSLYMPISVCLAFSIYIYIYFCISLSLSHSLPLSDFLAFSVSLTRHIPLSLSRLNCLTISPIQ